jgi:hypothetical protein
MTTQTQGEAVYVGQLSRSAIDSRSAGSGMIPILVDHMRWLLPLLSAGALLGLNVAKAMKKSLHSCGFAAATLLLFTNCASMNTPVYESVKGSLKPEPGKALVLIYFKSHYGSGVAKWHIYANDQLLIASFTKGSFFSFQANPGELRLSTTWNMTYIPLGLAVQSLGLIPARQPVIQIQPGQTYYLEMHVGPVREVIRQVSEEDGEKGIAKCNWINPS